MLAKALDGMGQGEYWLTITPATTRDLQRANLKNEADALLQQGDDQHRTGKFQKALLSWQEALDIYREIDDRLGEAQTLNNIGNANGSLGNYPEALEFYEQSLVITRGINNSYSEAATLNNIGLVNQLLGNYLKAMGAYEQSLFIKREINDQVGEAYTLNNLGIVNQLVGNYAEALNYYQQNLSIAQQVDDRNSEAAALNNIGLVNQLLENYSEAMESYQQSLDISQEIGASATKADSLNNIGYVNWLMGNDSEALDYYQQGLNIAQEIGDQTNEADSLNNIGFVYLDLGHWSQAELSFKEAIHVLEALRDSALPDADKVSLFDIQAKTYKGLEQALTLQDKPEAALEVAERGRARAFVDLLTERLSRQQTESLSTKSPNLEAIQQIAMNQQSVLVEYSLIDVGPESPSLYIWVVQPSGQLDFRKVNLNEETIDLSGLIANSRDAIRVRSRGGFELAANQSDNTEQFRELHQLLIEPIADLLPSNPEQQVVFIPQGALFLVPFPALLDDAGTHLIEKHTILTAPSIQVLDLNQQQQQSQVFSAPLEGREMLLVGNPTMPEVGNPGSTEMQKLSDLPGAEREAEAIATFFNATALLGEQATEATVKDRIGGARVVHLATHGLLEYGNPQDSGVQDVPGAIALTPGDGEDGLLTSAEILEELDLNAELVILSACDTGLGNITGDGVIGLSRSLIAAGAPSVIVSLWSVPDAPTAELMTEFYRQMHQGQDKAQALRQAMLETMKSHPEPGDWAAFTLIGEAQ